MFYELYMDYFYPILKCFYKEKYYTILILRVNISKLSRLYNLLKVTVSMW